MTVRVAIETSFVNLTPEGQKSYEEIRSQIGALLAKPDGLTLALNALVASGTESTVDEIRHWIEGVESIDSRDLVGFCHGPERIIMVEATLVDP